MINLKYPVEVKASYVDAEGHKFGKQVTISPDTTEHMVGLILKHLIVSASETQHLTEAEKKELEEASK